ncbi:hypothetical protein LAZ67_4001221 [Cordylochernes scorpioides]|uniref:Uncharacterized protein n=1 Tax=Cordylochernes scorpioides TaxID=51811 RepID=A0ABY6KBQ4_9ARAC|nr:hypothetical protein LAZ67_4001221 [Cordylochernes scorpioides]
MFILKRVQQREEIKKIIQADSYSRRYDLIKALHHQIFEHYVNCIVTLPPINPVQTLMEAHTTLDRANYEVKPITQFPEDHKLKESLRRFYNGTKIEAEDLHRILCETSNISNRNFLNA